MMHEPDRGILGKRKCHLERTRNGTMQDFPVCNAKNHQAPLLPLILAGIVLFPFQAWCKPVVHAMYYSYFKADFAAGDFFQWNGYRSWEGRVHNPNVHLGPEAWRYDLSLGSGAPGSGIHYPFLGRYDNFSDDEVVLWQFRCMKKAGINAVCASNLAHGADPDFPARLLGIARDVGIGLYVLDENGAGELGSAPNQQALDDAVDDLVAKCNATLVGHGADEAYFKIDTRPVYSLPFWIPAFGEPGAEQVQIMQNALARFKTGVTVAGREPWLYSSNVYVANFSGSLSYDVNPPPGPTVHMSQAWADTGFESFTCWDPLGIQEQYNRQDVDEGVRDNNLSQAFATYVSNQQAFGATPIVPIQPGFDRRNNEGPGAGGLPPTDPKFTTPHDPAYWRVQVRRGIDSGTPHLWIAQWDEWHEDQTLEPAWGFRDESGREDPFTFLRILAEELGRTFFEPSLPPESSVDPAI